MKWLTNFFAKMSRLWSGKSREEFTYQSDAEVAADNWPTMSRAISGELDPVSELEFIEEEMEEQGYKDWATARSR